MSLNLIQEQNEQLMLDKGTAAVISKWEKHVTQQKESDTSHGNRIVLKYTPKLTEFTKAHIKDSKKSKGRGNRFIGIFDDLTYMPIEKMVVIALRQSISRVLSNDFQTVKSMAYLIGRMIAEEYTIHKIGKVDTAYQKRLIKAMNSKVEYEKRRKVLVTRIKNDYETDTPLNGFDSERMIALGLFFLEAIVKNTPLIEMKLVKSTKNKDKTKHKNVLTVIPTPALIKHATESRDRLADLAYRPELMVVPPTPASPDNLHHYGYLSNRITTKFITRGTRAQEKLINGASMAESFKAHNKLQNTKLRVNTRVLQVLKTLRAQHECLAEFKLSLPEIQVLPEKPEVTDRTCDEFVEYRKAATRVNKHNTRAVKDYWELDKILDDAERYSAFDNVYSPYKRDTRARAYGVASLNPQKADHIKSLLQFGEAREIGERGIWWLKLHITGVVADCPWTGVKVDKRPLAERVEWVETHMAKLLAIAADPLSNLEFLQFDKPWQSLAALYELEGVALNGAKHMSRQRIDQDATCSGLQIIAGLTRCEKTAALVNLNDSETPYDIYQHVADKINTILADRFKDVECRMGLEGSIRREYAGEDEDTVNKNVREALALYDWMCFVLARKHTKQPVMTYVYSSEVAGMKEQLADGTLAQLQKVAMQKAFDLGLITGTYSYAEFQGLPHETKSSLGYPFGDSPLVAAHAIAKLMFSTIVKTCGKGGEVMQWLKECGRLIATKNNGIVKTTSPNGFPVYQKYVKTGKKKLNITVLDRKFNLELIKKRTVGDARKASASMSPNIIHSIDAALLENVVNLVDTDSIVAVHDSFGVHPDKADDLFRATRAAYKKTFSGDYLASLHTELKAQCEDIPSPPAKGTWDIDNVLTATYAFI